MLTPEQHVEWIVKLLTSLKISPENADHINVLNGCLFVARKMQETPDEEWDPVWIARLEYQRSYYAGMGWLDAPSVVSAEAGDGKTELRQHYIAGEPIPPGGMVYFDEKTRKMYRAKPKEHDVIVVDSDDAVDES